MFQLKPNRGVTQKAIPLTTQNISVATIPFLKLTHQRTSTLRHDYYENLVVKANTPLEKYTKIRSIMPRNLSSATPTKRKRIKDNYSVNSITIDLKTQKVKEEVKPFEEIVDEKQLMKKYFENINRQHRLSHNPSYTKQREYYKIVNNILDRPFNIIKMEKSVREALSRIEMRNNSSIADSFNECELLEPTNRENSAITKYCEMQKFESKTLENVRTASRNYRGKSRKKEIPTLLKEDIIELKPWGD